MEFAINAATWKKTLLGRSLGVWNVQIEKDHHQFMHVFYTNVRANLASIIYGSNFDYKYKSLWRKLLSVSLTLVKTLDSS